MELLGPSAKQDTSGAGRGFMLYCLHVCICRRDAMFNPENYVSQHVVLDRCESIENGETKCFPFMFLQKVQYRINETLRYRSRPPLSTDVHFTILSLSPARALSRICSHERCCKVMSCFDFIRPNRDHRRCLVVVNAKPSSCSTLTSYTFHSSQQARGNGMEASRRKSGR